jgi:hypothetical protein
MTDSSSSPSMLGDEPGSQGPLQGRAEGGGASESASAELLPPGAHGSWAAELLRKLKSRFLS